MKVEDQLILDVICRHEIRDQGELVLTLNNHGIDITQASLSRRLKKLEINKHKGVYKSSQSAKTAIFPITTSIKKIMKAPPNIIVIHTIPGHASSLAYHIDQNMRADENHSMIAGTIAGDDTVLVVVADINKLDLLAAKFEELAISK